MPVKANSDAVKDEADYIYFIEIGQNSNSFINKTKCHEDKVKICMSHT